MVNPYEQDLSLALELADQADRITAAHFAAGSAVTVKPDRSLVTAADLETERTLAAVLADRRPHDAIAAEELHGDQVGAGRCWVIDPIDHTNNFARGLSYYGTLIALLEDGQPVVGVVSAPSLRRRWWALRGGGAFADGRGIRVSAVDELSEAHLSFAELEVWNRRGLLGPLVELVSEARWTFGSGGFLAQMAVAEGKLDVALDPTGHVWDLAASQVIVQEAGGVFTDVHGRVDATRGTAVVTNGLLHEEVLSRLTGDRDAPGPAGGDRRPGRTGAGGHRRPPVQNPRASR
ncbi:inositol monophosphatase family protein [Micromonospora halotolerans]|uniref:inositol-phosphate phosphatase n=1 Tax=Micromonospora halotolerans TaxID=709879 RepID=A0ABY9ZU77_9ACTN|nr:inositol monophosphatase family protein [Micromonospora halotolerans]WNM38863.1 inositol monophosphatase family protein [Micromonospora halotolerans]